MNTKLPSLRLQLLPHFELQQLIGSVTIATPVAQNVASRNTMNGNSTESLITSEGGGAYSEYGSRGRASLHSHSKKTSRKQYLRDL